MSKDIWIHVDGNQVIAEDKNYRKGVACCHPDDNFDYETGANIALKRYFETTINVGDRVKIVDVGLSFTTYTSWVEQHVKDKCHAIRYCYDSAPSTVGAYKVLYIAKEYLGRTLCFIERESSFAHFRRCYLVDIEGLEKI